MVSIEACELLSQSGESENRPDDACWLLKVDVREASVGYWPRIWLSWAHCGGRYVRLGCNDREVWTLDDRSKELNVPELRGAMLMS